MIKTYCDVCGKETADAEFFEEFQFCAECWKAAASRLASWEQAKLKLFKEMFAKEETCTCKAAAKPYACKTTCKCGRHKHELVKPKTAPLTNVELAQEIGKKPNVVQCYAYRHGLGTVDKKRHVRFYNQEDADIIRKHFEN